MASDILFGDTADDDGTEAPLRISEEYAKKYNERKDKEELTRAARILADEDVDDESSEEETEDEGAGLLTEQVNTKIFDTLGKIKRKDPSIYNPKKVFFDDKDFSEAAEQSADKSASSKSMTYKDFMRKTLLQEGADAIIKEEEALEELGKKSKKKGKSVVDEQRELKAAILKAAHDGDEEDDLLTLKSKTEAEVEAEEADFKEFLAKESKKKPRQDADEAMADYWQEDEELDENEKFLRDFIINRSWLETTSMQAPVKEKKDGTASSDDEKHLDEQDEFEANYNFRFEMEEGRQIQGHARFPTDTIRQRDDKRKRKRHELKERKDAEKIRRTEELKRLKNLKKQEIQRRLQQLCEVTGNEDTALGKIDLDEDFDPEEHDKKMTQLLGEDFEAQEETLDPKDLMKAPDGIDDLDITKDGDELPQKIAAKAKAKVKAAGASAADADDAEAEGDGEEPEGDDGQWWLCDQCSRGIPAGKKRFDCTVCANYTLCVYCFRVRHHPHKFVRRRVPDNCDPPADVKGKVQGGSVEEQKAWDEYFQLDFEDIIGGDLPTRFKYRQVKPDDYGLSAAEILTKDDKELNQVVSLKKLRPYREENVAEEDEEDDVFAGKGVPRWRREKTDTVQKGRGKGQPKARIAKPKRDAAPKVSRQRMAAFNFGLDRRKEKKKAESAAAASKKK